MGTPRPIYDFFIDRDGVEYIVEVYEAYDGAVHDYGMYPLLEDGSKGPAVDTDALNVDDEVQEKYRSYRESDYDL